jgi:hypothetical protein
MTSKRKAIGSAAVLIALAGSSWLYAQRKPTKLTAIDYSEIQELYATYAQALDLNQPENLAATFADDGELVASKGPGQATAVRTPIRGHDALVQNERRHGNFGSRHLTSDLVIKQTTGGPPLAQFRGHANFAAPASRRLSADVFIPPTAPCAFIDRIRADLTCFVEQTE